MMTIQAEHSTAVQKRAWWTARALVFLTAALYWCRPYLLANETIYLIPGKKLFDPHFLARDWTWQRSDTSHLIFDLFVGPLTLILDPLTIVLAGRLAVWGLLVWALARLARAMGLGPWGFLSGTLLWIVSGQSIAAGEWVFGGFEAKGVAYVLLFLALENVLKERFGRAAFCAGLAGSFHVLVGGWGLMALAVAMGAMAWRRKSVPVLRYVLPGCLLALPGVVPALVYTLKDGPMSRENYEICVLFRDFLHLDPRYFLDRYTSLKIAFCAALTFFMLAKLYPRAQARALIVFLGCLLTLFAAGVAAREAEYLAFLFYYPFRLAAVMLPLLFFYAGVRSLNTGGPPSPGAKHRRVRALLLAVLLGSVSIHVYRTDQRPLSDLSRSWTGHLRGQKDPLVRTAAWIRTNIPDDAVLVAPPWQHRFWILAERALVATYKQPPINARNREWLDRLVDLNGGVPFTGNGKRAMVELRANYPKLSREHLRVLRDRYGARYYVNEEARPDLGWPLVYSNAVYHIYEIGD